MKTAVFLSLLLFVIAWPAAAAECVPVEGESFCAEATTAGGDSTTLALGACKGSTVEGGCGESDITADLACDGTVTVPDYLVGCSFISSVCVPNGGAGGCVDACNDLGCDDLPKPCMGPPPPGCWCQTIISHGPGGKIIVQKGWWCRPAF